MQKERNSVLGGFGTASVMLLATGFMIGCGPTTEAGPQTPAGEPVERVERRTAERVEVEIVNNITPEGEAQVYAIPERGTRSLLGSVGAGETESILFSPEPEEVEERYRLLAVIGGDEIQSETFIPSDATVIRWDIDADEVEYESPSEEMNEQADDGAPDQPDQPDADQDDDPDTDRDDDSDPFASR